MEEHTVELGGTPENGKMGGMMTCKQRIVVGSVMTSLMSLGHECTLALRRSLLKLSQQTS